MRGRRRLFQLLGVCSLFLLIYSGVRAYVLSFVFDEATSFSMISGEHPEWKQSASNHPLNTRLMSWMYRMRGPAEWALRFPNVVAHALYLGFGLLLLRRLTNSWMVVLGFVVLNLNPFMLDFSRSRVDTDSHWAGRWQRCTFYKTHYGLRLRLEPKSS